MIAVQSVDHSGRKRSPSYLVPISALAGSLVLLNLAAYVAVPALFDIDRARAPYTIANNYELTRVYSRAITEYNEVINQYPDSKYAALAAIGIANSQFLKGDLSDSIASFRELLTTLADRDDYPENRLAILSGLSLALQDAGDAEGFREVYAMLQEGYPEADATLRASRYAEELKAAAAAVSNGGSSGSELLRIEMPAEVFVRRPFTMTIVVEPGLVPEGSFGLAMNLSFWDGFKLLRAAPPSTSMSEFWGKRIQAFKMLGGVTKIELELEPLKAGSFQLDLDLEKSFDIIELGKARTIEVLE